jgi:hypothetical protein
MSKTHQEFPNNKEDKSRSNNKLQQQGTQRWKHKKTQELLAAAAANGGELEKQKNKSNQ